MGRKRAYWVRKAATRATVLVLFLWPNSALRAAPTILLRFEHSGREAGTTLKDSIRLQVAGFTWSDGTVDLLREPAWHTSPSHPYVAGGADSTVTSDMPAARYALRFSGAADNAAAGRAEIFDMAIPQATERWLRTSSESSPATIMHLIETTFEPTVWSPEIHR